MLMSDVIRREEFQNIDASGGLFLVLGYSDSLQVFFLIFLRQSLLVWSPLKRKFRKALLSQSVRGVDYEKTNFLWFFLLCSETARRMGWKLSSFFCLILLDF